MGLIGRFEKGLDRAVNGVFAKAFRSEVQPVEIASALRRECDDKAAIVSRDRTIAPNVFVVELGQADHERLGEWEAALGQELSAAVIDHARQQRYSFVGPVQVAFDQAEDLDTGVFRIRSSAVGAPGGAGGAASSPVPHGAAIAGFRLPLPGSRPPSACRRQAGPPAPGRPRRYRVRLPWMSTVASTGWLVR